MKAHFKPHGQSERKVVHLPMTFRTSQRQVSVDHYTEANLSFLITVRS